MCREKGRFYRAGGGLAIRGRPWLVRSRPGARRPSPAGGACGADRKRAVAGRGAPLIAAAPVGRRGRACRCRDGSRRRACPRGKSNGDRAPPASGSRTSSGALASALTIILVHAVYGPSSRARERSGASGTRERMRRPTGGAVTHPRARASLILRPPGLTGRMGLATGSSANPQADGRARPHGLLKRTLPRGGRGGGPERGAGAPGREVLRSVRACKGQSDVPRAGHEKDAARGGPPSPLL